MSVHLTAEGTVTYLPDRLLVRLNRLRLKDVTYQRDAFIESVGLEAYAADKQVLGKAARVPIRRTLSKGGEMQVENIELTVPMSSLRDDFVFYLTAHLPSDDYWISEKVAMPGLARVR